MYLFIFKMFRCIFLLVKCSDVSFYLSNVQMYGEKTEEAEELRLDLEDVKEMYKMQIVQLTGQPQPEM